MWEQAKIVDRFVGLEIGGLQAPLPEPSGQPAGILNSLAELNRVLAGTDGFGNVVRRALEILGGQYGVARAAVWLCPEDGTDELQVTASFGLPGGKRKLLQGFQYPAGQAVIRQVVETGCDFMAPVAGRQKEGTCSALDHADAQRSGETLFFLCLPILLQPNKPIGVFSLETACPRDQNQESLLNLFRVVASMLAQAFTVNQLIEAATQRLLDENANLRAELSERYDFSRLIGDSGAMRQVYEQIAQVACTSATVLVSGETGTGKELVAHALHINSPRAAKPFIKVNCAALPESLIETELFGHERGAFTGAITNKPGRFELAEGGTLFLDEIGELSANVQIKLLRVLQEREFERVGGTETLRVDVRVIAATHRELEKEVAAGRFRADLYYRLNVFTITMPALRERREDIPLLAEYFLKKYVREHGKDVGRLSSPALERLRAYGWPGNVRELENALERAVVVADGPLIHHYHLPPALQTIEPDNSRAGGSLFESVEAYERELICDALRTTRGNRNRAAKLLKVSERVLSYKVRKYALDCDAFRS